MMRKQSVYRTLFAHGRVKLVREIGGAVRHAACSGADFCGIFLAKL
jgi:hypothetical protein